MKIFGGADSLTNRKTKSDGVFEIDMSGTMFSEEGVVLVSIVSMLEIAGLESTCSEEPLVLVSIDSMLVVGVVGNVVNDTVSQCMIYVLCVKLGYQGSNVSLISSNVVFHVLDL